MKIYVEDIATHKKVCEKLRSMWCRWKLSGEVLNDYRINNWITIFSEKSTMSWCVWKDRWAISWKMFLWTYDL